MRSPRNRIKLTGDTHLPDVGMDSSKEDDEADMLLVEDVRVYADGYVPPAQPQTMVVALVPEELEPVAGAEHPGRAQALERAAGRLESRKPWLTLGLGLAGGFLLMQTLRRALRR